MPRLSLSSHDLTLAIIYINVAIYSMCFQLQRPLEPFLVELLVKSEDDQGEDATVAYAKLTAFFSLMQTPGSFASGLMLDKFGVKRCFYVTFLASALSYFFLSQSTTIFMLYSSKVPSMFQSGFLCAQVGISRNSANGPERLKALGKLTTSYAVGMVIGPYLGGYFASSGDFYLGARLAVGGSLISAFLTFFMSDEVAVEEQEKKIDEGEVEEKKDIKPSPSTITSIISVLSLTYILLTSKVLTGIANSLTSTTFPLILKNSYGLTSQSMGTYMSLSSFCNAVINGLFLGKFVSLFGDDTTALIKSCVLTMSILSILQSLIALPSNLYLTLDTQRYLYLGLTFVCSLAQYVLATAMTSASTNLVPSELKGTLLGIEHTLFAVARIFAPGIAVYLLNRFGQSAVSSVSGLIFFGVYIGIELFGSGGSDVGKKGEEEVKKKKQ